MPIVQIVGSATITVTATGHVLEGAGRLTGAAVVTCSSSATITRTTSRITLPLATVPKKYTKLASISPSETLTEINARDDKPVFKKLVTTKLSEDHNSG